jgi:hypothetical protein
MTIVRELPEKAFLKGGLFRKFDVNLPKPALQVFTRRKEPWETSIEGVRELN